MAAARQKTVDKGEVFKKVFPLLRKTYGSASAKDDLPVLETMLYAVCLEDTSLAAAEAHFSRIKTGFHDLNEVRVSSIFELEDVFKDLPHAAHRADRVRNILQYVFEATYSFDFESLRRKTAELAIKQLGKIRNLSSFIRSYVMQRCLGSHVLPIDAASHRALIFLGLAETDSNPESAADALRGVIRKADGPVFCHVLRCFATDSKFAPVFEKDVLASREGQAFGHERLDLLFHSTVDGFLKKEAAKHAVVAKAQAQAQKLIDKEQADKAALAAKNGSTKSHAKGKSAPAAAKAKKSPAPAAAKSKPAKSVKAIKSEKSASAKKTAAPAKRAPAATKSSKKRAK